MEAQISLGRENRVDLIGRLGRWGQEWEESGIGRGNGSGREYRERQLELGAFGDWCGNLMQWKLPRIYKGGTSKDF